MIFDGYYDKRFVFWLPCVIGRDNGKDIIYFEEDYVRYRTDEDREI